VDPERPVVLRDEWLGERIAYVFLPAHCLRASVVSQAAVVVADMRALAGRPYGDVAGVWGWRSWLIGRGQAPGLLVDLGLAAGLIEQVLAEVDRVLAEPVSRLS
jgi:hypothetical protein